MPAFNEFCYEIECLKAHVAQKHPKVPESDMSFSHLELARQQLACPDIAKYKLVYSDIEGFQPRSGSGLRFSCNVIQHNMPSIIRISLNRAFARLSPLDMAVCHGPTRFVGCSFNLRKYLSGCVEQPGVETHCLPQEEIWAIAEQRGRRVFELIKHISADPPQYGVTNIPVLARAMANSGGINLNAS